MYSIEKIDANFQIRTMGDGRVMGYYEIPSPHFDLYGVFYETPIPQEDGSAFPPIRLPLPLTRK